MLQQLVTDIARLKEERRQLIRSGNYSPAAARQIRRNCKTRVPMPSEAIELVGEWAYICSDCRRQREAALELVEESKVPIRQCAKCKGFSVRVYKRLDIPTEYCFQPVILRDGEPIHQIFVRPKSPQIACEHFARPAIDHFLKTGRWPVKQGIALPI